MVGEDVSKMIEMLALEAEEDTMIDDVDEMHEDEETETLTETTEEAGIEESFYLSADDDADEFEVTLAGFRSEPAKVVTAPDVTEAPITPPQLTSSANRASVPCLIGSVIVYFSVPGTLAMT